MAKQKKIKRYTERQRTFKARPRPLRVILTVLLLAGLVGFGIFLYQPVKDFVSQTISPPPLSEPEALPVPPQPSSAESSEPLPPPQPEAPDKIRALIMPGEAAANRDVWDAFIAQLPQSINTVLVEIKDSDGFVSVKSSETDAAKWEAVTENPLDLKELADYLKERGYHLAVRLAAFSDPIAARALREEGAVMYGDGLTWLDNSPERGGKQWLNPYAPRAREYLVSLGAEAAKAGAVLVLYDRFQFPYDPTGTAIYGETGGVTRHEMLAVFSNELRVALKPHGARASVYLPVGTLAQPEPNNNELYYGGSPLEFVPGEAALGMHPDFLTGATIEEKLGRITEAKERADELDVRLMPVLTAAADAPHEQQIEIIEALGFEEYILYSQTN